MHGRTAMAERLMDYRIFVNDEDRQIYIYRRDERDYVYDEGKSVRATGIFSETKSFLEDKGGRNGEYVEFDETPVRDVGQPE